MNSAWKVQYFGKSHAARARIFPKCGTFRAEHTALKCAIFFSVFVLDS